MKNMKEKLKLIINKKYPENWNKKNEEYRRKKEDEFDTASFFLYNHSAVKDIFEGADSLCVEFDDSPDFFVYSNEKSSKKLGLEITDCYVNEVRNSKKPRNLNNVYSDLEKICNEVIKDIQKNDKSNLYQKVNYISVIFTHEIMIGAQFDKRRLKLELRNFILNKNKYNGEYVCKVDVGYSFVYPKDKLKILLDSNMMYIVPRISDLVQMQKAAGVADCDPVLQSIASKEKKLNIYKEKCKYDVHEWWLCINVPKMAYMNPISYRLPNNFKSKYDKIFLVTKSFFKDGVYLIYES